MEGGARIAIGVGIGYLLGRTRKMRFALSLAGAAMSRRGAGGAPGELLKRGTSLLESKELSQITDTVRGELLGAVRSAAVTAASNRIDALSARLQQSAAPEEEEEDRGGDRKTETDEDDHAHEPRDDEQESAEEDLEDEYPAEEAEEEDEDDTEQPTTRARTRRASPAKASRTGSRTSSRASDTAERRTPAPRRRRARDEADEAPVRRTRR